MDHAGPDVPCHQTVHAVEDFIDVPLFTTHYARRDLGTLPQILVSRLRGGHVKPALEPFLQTLHDAALVLQRLGAEYFELPDNHSDDQTASDKRPSHEPARIGRFA
jgi:hypothetical protein